jgi:hypothetical protein
MKLHKFTFAVLACAVSIGAFGYSALGIDGCYDQTAGCEGLSKTTNCVSNKGAATAHNPIQSNGHFPGPPCGITSPGNVACGDLGPGDPCGT